MGAVALIPFIATGARGQSTISNWHEKAVCGRLTEAMRSLPKLTPASDWPTRIKIRRVRFPKWQETNAEVHLDDVIKIRWLQGTRASPVPHDWAGLRPRALEEIKSGKIRVEEATVDARGNLGPIDLIRIKELQDQNTSVSGVGPTSKPSYEYYTYIHSAKNFPKLHDLSLNTPLTGVLGAFPLPSMPLIVDREFYILSGGGLDTLSQLYIAQVTPTQAITVLFDNCQLTYKGRGGK